MTPIPLSVGNTNFGSYLSWLRPTGRSDPRVTPTEVLELDKRVAALEEEVASLKIRWSLILGTCPHLAMAPRSIGLRFRT